MVSVNVNRVCVDVMPGSGLKTSYLKYFNTDMWERVFPGEQSIGVSACVHHSKLLVSE